jgi:hypothetical protein
MARMGLEEVTIRDFGGGLDVSDSDKALSSKYQVVSDNVIRGTDGHFRTRYGSKLFAMLRTGTETVVAATSYTLTTVNTSGVVKVTKTAHGYASGDHINITSFTGGAINGLAASLFTGVFGIVVNDANNFSFYVRGAATSSGTGSRTIGWTRDTHVLSGGDIFGRYYKNNLIVFSDDGEIAAVDSTGTATRIWNYQRAASLTVQPWSKCQRISAEIIRGRLIAVNGALNDKPIAIDGTTANYLVDAATLSNGAIPRAEFVIAASNYAILVNTEYGATKLEIGAKNTVITCSRELDPDDAVEIDVGMLTQTVDATILGASVIRSRVFLGFTDRSMLGTLGIYNDAGSGTLIHEPDFNDNIAEFGTFSHSSIISLGNDLFCAALNGINSLELSKASGEFTPQTVSDLIHPILLKHFARLSEDDKRYKTFAVWDNSQRAYILFAPKYSAGSRTLEPNPVIATSTLQPHNLMYLRARDHVWDEGDYVDISGATGITGVSAGAINGRRRIRAVVDKDTLVIETDAYTANLNSDLGGSAVVVQPVNDETIAYVFEYNPRLKIRRWTRYRDLSYRWGARSQLGRMYYGDGVGKIWHFGDAQNPYSADRLGEWDLAWSTSHAFTVGQRVKDTDGTVYECLIAHTSPGSGTFTAARTAAPDNWEVYQGEPINFSMETAWSEFQMRLGNKQIELCRFDTKGSAEFNFSIFTNSIYDNFESFLLEPNRTSVFIGSEGPGYGAGLQNYGGGRNTGTEMLHSIPAYGKLFKLRFDGASVHPLIVNAVTLLYHRTKVVT